MLPTLSSEWYNEITMMAQNTMPIVHMSLGNMVKGDPNSTLRRTGWQGKKVGPFHPEPHTMALAGGTGLTPGAPT